jgi:hypothetical protein
MRLPYYKEYGDNEMYIISRVQQMKGTLNHSLSQKQTFRMEVINEGNNIVFLFIYILSNSRTTNK